MILIKPFSPKVVFKAVFPPARILYLQQNEKRVVSANLFYKFASKLLKTYFVASTYDVNR